MEFLGLMFSHFLENKFMFINGSFWIYSVHTLTIIFTEKIWLLTLIMLSNIVLKALLFMVRSSPRHTLVNIYNKQNFFLHHCPSTLDHDSKFIPINKRIREHSKQYESHDYSLINQSPHLNFPQFFKKYLLDDYISHKTWKYTPNWMMVAYFECKLKSNLTGNQS